MKIFTKTVVRKSIHLLSKNKYLFTLLNYLYEISPNILISKIEPLISPPNFNYKWNIRLGNKLLNFTYFQGENRTIFHFPLSYKKNDFGIRQIEVLLHEYYPINRLYLDIGANYGLRSLYYAAMGRQCYLFEPNINCIEITKRLIKENFLTNIEIVNCVVGNESKNVEFHLSKNTYLSSLSKSHSANYNDFLKTIDMKMIRLDDFLFDRDILRKVSLVKIDVEGFEFDVLKGALNLFKSNDLNVIIEVLENSIDRFEIFKFMKSLGFEIFGILKSHTRIILSPCESEFSTDTIDFICIKDKKLSNIFSTYCRQ